MHQARNGEAARQRRLRKDQVTQALPRVAVDPRNTDVYAHAHELADAGYSVLPAARSKRPLTRHGVKDATRNHEQIETWASEHPEANLAVACGERSGGLVAVDIDNLERTRMNGRLRLPSTPMVRTGSGGYHLWCSSTRPFKTVFTQWGELRGEESIVVAPPSVHQTGNSYQWLVPLDLEELLPVEALTGFLPDVEKALEQGFSLESLDTKWTKAICLGSPGSLEAWFEARDWSSVGRSPELAGGFCRLLGLPPVGKRFACLLPGCKRHPHALLWHSPEAGFMYRCFSKATTPARNEPGRTENGIALSIPAVYAAHCTGKRRQLSSMELIYWTKRLVLDGGLVERPKVTLPQLPPDLPDSRYKLRETLQELFEARAVGVGLEATPCANEFLSGLSGLPKSTVMRAKGDLLKHNVIEKAGTYSSVYGQPGTLYLPGGSA